METLSEYFEWKKNIKVYLNPDEDDNSGAITDWLSVQWHAIETIEREMERVILELQDICSRRKLFNKLRQIPQALLELSNLKRRDFFVMSRLDDDSLDDPDNSELCDNFEDLIKKLSAVSHELSEDTIAVLKTAEYVHQFRMELSNNVESYRILVERATKAMNQGLLSVEGSSEIAGYCSAAMTAKIVGFELLSALSENRIEAPLDAEHEGSVDLTVLQKCVGACETFLKGQNRTATGLEEVLDEARCVLAYRTAINLGEWDNAKNLISHFQPRELETSYKEREHVLKICSFKTLPWRVHRVLSLRILSGSITTITQEVTYRIDLLEPLLRIMDDIIAYQPSIGTNNDFHVLVSNSWACHGLFTAIKNKAWGAIEFLDGCKFSEDSEQCSDEFLSGVLGFIGSSYLSTSNVAESETKHLMTESFGDRSSSDYQLCLNLITVVQKDTDSTDLDLGQFYSKRSSMSDTVASVLCSLDWSSLSDVCRRIFVVARDILIDSILAENLIRAGKERTSFRDEFCRLMINPRSVHSLDQSLAAVAYTKTLAAECSEDFHLSENTLAHVSNIENLKACRVAVLTGDVDLLLASLQPQSTLSWGFRGEDDFSNIMSGKGVTATELVGMKCFAVECIAEKLLRDAIDAIAYTQTELHQCSHPAISALQKFRTWPICMNKGSKLFQYFADIGLILLELSSSVSQGAVQRVHLLAVDLYSHLSASPLLFSPSISLMELWDDFQKKCLPLMLSITAERGGINQTKDKPEQTLYSTTFCSSHNDEQLIHLQNDKNIELQLKDVGLKSSVSMLRKVKAGLDSRNKISIGIIDIPRDEESIDPPSSFLSLVLDSGQNSSSWKAIKRAQSDMLWILVARITCVCSEITSYSQKQDATYINHSHSGIEKVADDSSGRKTEDYGVKDICSVPVEIVEFLEDIEDSEFDPDAASMSISRVSYLLQRLQRNQGISASQSNGRLSCTRKSGWMLSKVSKEIDNLRNLVMRSYLEQRLQHVGKEDAIEYCSFYETGSGDFKSLLRIIDQLIKFC